MLPRSVGASAAAPSGALRPAPGGASVDQRPGAGLQRREVARADPPAGAGEQPAQRVAGGRVDEHGERRDDVGDLGHLEQAAEPDDLHRQAALAQRRRDAGQLLAGPDEHRHRRAARPSAGRSPCQHGGEPVGQRLGLLGDGARTARRSPRPRPAVGAGREVGQRLVGRRQHRRTRRWRRRARPRRCASWWPG